MSTLEVVVPDLIAPRRSGVFHAIRSTGVAGMTSLSVIVLAAFFSCFGTLLAPDNPVIGSLTNAWVGPSSAHLLGFDVEGRDVVSRLMAGTWSSIAGPLLVVAVSVALGTAIALFAVWRGGKVDAILSSGLDIVFAFPAILLAIIAAAVFGPGFFSSSIALAVAYTPYLARVLRGAAMKERQQDYVAALSVQGASGVTICIRHILPNISSLVVAQATIFFGYAMVTLAALSYLGLAIQPPSPNWGLMISENQVGIISGFPIAAVSAAICIVIVVVAFNVLGDRLFDVADGRRL